MGPWPCVGLAVSQGLGSSQRRWLSQTPVSSPSRWLCLELPSFLRQLSPPAQRSSGTWSIYWGWGSQGPGLLLAQVSSLQQSASRSPHVPCPPGPPCQAFSGGVGACQPTFSRDSCPDPWAPAHLGTQRGLWLLPPLGLSAIFCQFPLCLLVLGSGTETRLRLLQSPRPTPSWGRTPGPPPLLSDPQACTRPSRVQIISTALRAVPPLMGHPTMRGLQGYRGARWVHKVPVGPAVLTPGSC